MVSLLLDLQAWLQEHICDKLQLKASEKDLRANDTTQYTYTLAHPRVHLFTIAPSNNEEAPAPAMVLQVMEAESSAEGTLYCVRLQFLIWNPGIHNGDLFEKHGSAYMHKESAYTREYQEGWMDLWNFMDRTLHEVQKTMVIAGRTVDTDRSIRCTPSTADGLILDEYPNFSGTMEFYLREKPAQLADMEYL